MANNKNPTDKFRPSDSKFKYEEYPFYWIARLDARYTALMERKLKPLGMTVTGWRVCLILRQNGAQSMSEISAHSAVKLSTVTRTVYGLRDKGYLEVRSKETDARVSVVSITPSGLDLIETVVMETAPIISRTFEDMAHKDLEKLNALLANLFEHLPEHQI